MAQRTTMTLSKMMIRVETDANQSEMRLGIEVAEWKKWTCLMQMTMHETEAKAELEAAQCLSDAAGRREKHRPRIAEMMDRIQVKTAILEIEMMMTNETDQIHTRYTRRDQIEKSMLKTIVHETMVTAKDRMRTTNASSIYP
jgi:hypothetical protein